MSALVVPRDRHIGVSVVFRGQGLQLRLWPGDYLHVYDLAGHHSLAQLPADWVFRAVFHYLDGHRLQTRFNDEVARTRPEREAPPRDADTWEAPRSFVLGASRAARRAQRRSRERKEGA